MPLGIVSDDEFDMEVERVSPNTRVRSNGNGSKIEAEIKEIQGPGRVGGEKNIPQAVRQLIGISAIEDGSLELAKKFGVSSVTANHYANGVISPNYPNTSQSQQQLKNVTDSVRDRIATKARAKLLNALKHITDEALKGSRPRDLAGIAKDLAVVANTVEPERTETVTQGPTFLVYAPQIRKEEYFETIRVNE